MTNEQLLILIIIVTIIIIGVLLAKQTSRQSALQLTLIINHIKITGDIKMVQLTSTQQVSGQLKPQNRLGGPAQVEAGSVNVTSSNPDVVEIVRDEADETKFTAKAKGSGVAQIDYSADADLGEGVETISGFTGVEVTPAGAVGFGIAFGEPEEQAAPAAPDEPPADPV